MAAGSLLVRLFDRLPRETIFSLPEKRIPRHYPSRNIVGGRRDQAGRG